MCTSLSIIWLIFTLTTLKKMLLFLFFFTSIKEYKNHLLKGGNAGSHRRNLVKRFRFRSNSQTCLYYLEYLTDECNDDRLNRSFQQNP